MLRYSALFILLLFIAGCGLTSQSIPEISSSIKTICEQKGALECHGDCEDGFSEDCYFASGEFDKDYFRSDSGHGFPSEVRDSCIGVHSVSVCNECENSFRLMQDGSWVTVSCEEFFQAIKEKDKGCGDCVDIVSSGCC